MASKLKFLFFGILVNLLGIAAATVVIISLSYGPYQPIVFAAAFVGTVLIFNTLSCRILLSPLCLSKTFLPSFILAIASFISGCAFNFLGIRISNHFTGEIPLLLSSAITSLLALSYGSWLYLRGKCQITACFGIILITSLAGILTIALAMYLGWRLS